MLYGKLNHEDLIEMTWKLVLIELNDYSSGGSYIKMISFRLADPLQIDECGKDSIQNKTIKLEGDPYLTALRK